MQRKSLVFTVLLILQSWIFLTAQVPEGFVEYLSFDSCDVQEAQVTGNVSCECGVREESVLLDGLTGDIRYTNEFSNLYPSTGTFTLSFYFRHLGQSGNFVLLSKRAQCSNDNSLQITYSHPSRDISITASENINNFIAFTHRLEEGQCWTHVTLTKSANRIRLYINGEFVRSGQAAGGILDLGTAGPWNLGNGPCVGTVFRRFRGNIDEFVYYSRELQDSEIRQLYGRPDVITQRDTTIFLGDTLDLEVGNSCANQFLWTPNIDISSRNMRSVRVFPQESMTYFVNANHGNCNALDTVRIIVVDPNSVQCDQVFLANAFTPNGDGKNEVFKVDNPVVTEEIEILQVYDRWGGLVFETTDVYDSWDGTINGENAMPGVYIYKLVYFCNGEKKLVNGSVTLIR